MKEKFLKDIKDFEITIENDKGFNRVISCRNKNGDFNRLFRIITWNNHLCISGDMGDFVFSRVEDMFAFFRKDEIKHQGSYWLEKMTSCSVFGGGDNRGTEFKPDETKENVLKYIRDDEDWTLDEKQELEEAVENICFEDGNIRAYDSIINVFEDYGEYCGESIRHFLEFGMTYNTEWCLYAIVWTIQQYDKEKAEKGEQ